MDSSALLVTSKLLFVISTVNCAVLIGTANLKVTKFEPCDASVDYPIKIDGSFKTGDDGVQYFTSTSVLNVPLGEDSDYNVSIEYKKTVQDETFSPLIVIYDKSTCDAMNTYLGPKILESIEKAANIEPGKCPIEKGTYTIKDYPIDYKNIAFQSVPAGVLRATHMITNLKTNQILMCFVAECENFPKQ